MSEKTSTVEAHGRGRHAAESQSTEFHSAEPRSTELQSAEPHSTKGAYVTGGGLQPGHQLHRGPDHPGRRSRPERRTRLAGGAGPLPADRRARLPVGQPHRHCPPAAGPRGGHLASASPAPPTMPGPGPLTWIRTARTRCWASSGSRTPTSAASRTTPAGLPFRRWWTSPAGGGDQQLPPDHAGLLHGMDRVPPRRVRRSCTRSTCGGKSTSVNRRVFTEVNNGVYRCGFAGSQEAYDAAYDRLLDRPGLARGTACRPAIPGG